MSYELLGSKWGSPTPGRPSGEVTWASDLDDNLTYDTGRFDEGDFNAALAQAFQAWERVAAVDFTRIADFGAADITFDMGNLDGVIGKIVGSATIRSVNPSSGTLDRITDVDVTLDRLETWSPFGGGGTIDFFAVAAHEIGHAIGLDHVEDPTELMNAVLTRDTLGDGDIAGARALYGTDRGERSPEPAEETASEDDGGGGGGGAGILLLLGGLVGLLTAFFGGGAAAGAAVAAAHAPGEGGPDTDIGDDEGEALIAFLHDALGDRAEVYEEIHETQLPDAPDDDWSFL